MPTLGEIGIKGVEPIASLSNFVIAPRGTPVPIVLRLNTVLRSIMEMPDIKGKLEEEGLDVATSTPEELLILLQRASEVQRRS